MKQSINITPKIVNMFYIYGKLLPEKTYKRAYSYIVDDLSITEITSNEKISRACCYESIQNAIEKLEYYESKLHIAEKINKLDNKLSCYNEESCQKLIQEIKEIMEF